MKNPDNAAEIRRSLTDPRQLCAKLNLLKSAKNQANGVIICCPVHNENNPSCSVTRGSDGTIRAKCFGCDFAGDALALIAAVYGLSTDRSGFSEVLKVGADLAGLTWLSDELSGQGVGEVARPEPKPAPDPIAAPEYPTVSEVVELWETAASVSDDPGASRWLVSRMLDPDLVSARYLARAITRDTTAPSWATYQRNPWLHTGHTMVVPVWDSKGAMRSVRGCRVTQGDSPKRLPPAGRRASELMLANGKAVSVLRGVDKEPQRILFCEGEPDYLTLATKTDLPVFGVLNGAWTRDFAARVPKGSEVIVWTHADPAGDRYAAQVIESLSAKCIVWRKNP